MTARLRAALALLFILTLGVVWLYLYRNTQAVDPKRHGRVLDSIRAARQIDADWNVDMLKSLAEIHRNYDLLALSVTRMTTIQEQLGADARAGGGPRVEKAQSAMDDVVTQKIALIEQFKSIDALLKNSLRYLPTAHDQLQPALRRADAALESDLSALVAGVLKYQVLPDEGTAEALRGALPALSAAARRLAPASRDGVDNLLVHVEAVLRERARQAALMRELAQLPVTAKLDALGTAFTARFDLELQRQALFQQYLLVYSAFALLATAIAIGILLRRGVTELKRMNELVRRTTAALRQSETQLVHAEKMSMLGEVVSGIVHEINTPLGYLRSGLESSRENLDTVLQPHAFHTGRLLALLQSEAPGSAALAEQATRVDALQHRLAAQGILEETATLLDDGIEGVRQINETVVNLLNFSRLGRARMTGCRIESGLDSTLKLASHFLGARRVVRCYGPTPEIQCDLSQLNQVFLNVIKNAAQATAPDGEITITTSPEAGAGVRVDIADNGAGIPEQHLPQIFDAFFTGRKDEGGTGLGLSISQKIVEGHGGRIDVMSRAGDGATFSIFLPFAPPGSPCAMPAA
jgi:two-component system NtrC family sensor kinase